MEIGIFFAGFIVGGLAGMFTMCLAASGKLEDARTKQITERIDE